MYVIYITKKPPHGICTPGQREHWAAGVPVPHRQGRRKRCRQTSSPGAGYVRTDKDGCNKKNQ